MDNAFNKRLFGAWSILVAISLAYLWFDHEATHQGLPSASTVVTVVAICFALIKVRIIMREFMEVRNGAAGAAPHHRLLGRAHGASLCWACISPGMRWPEGGSVRLMERSSGA